MGSEIDLMAEVQHRETARSREAFEAWYAVGRDFAKVGETFNVSQQTIRNWAEWFDWRAQADRRDREAFDRAERGAIRRRANMLKSCREAGELMVARGKERLAKHPIESDQAAIAAVTRGVDVWRTAEGMPAYVHAILTSNEEDLVRLRTELDNRRRAAVAAGGPDAGIDALSALEAGDPDV